jgi:outer membrane protein assembly factor BamB
MNYTRMRRRARSGRFPPGPHSMTAISASRYLCAGSALLAGMAIALFAAGAPTTQTAKPPTFQGMNRRLRTASGRLADRLNPVWKFKTGGPVVSSATVAGGRVYIGSDDGHVYALRLKDGEKLWSFEAKAVVEATPLVEGGAVVVGSADGYLYSLDATTGGLRWKYKTEDKILGAANAAPAPGGKGTWIVVGSYDNRVHCVNAATGKRVWTYETDNYVNGSPAIIDGKVLVGGCDGILHVIRLSNGKKIRTIPIGDYIAGSAAVDGRYAYLGHYGSQVVCADLAAGRIAWTYQDRQFPYFSSPAAAADRIVIGGRDKRVHCLRRKDGKPLWEFRARGKVDSSPVICDGKVVVGSDDGRLYMLGLNDGRERWSYQIGAPVVSSPSVYDGMVFVGADDGYVYAFR